MNTMSTSRPLAALASILALVATVLAGAAAAPAHAADPTSADTTTADPVAATPTSQFCSGSAYVRKTLASGTTWEMCWRVENAKGLVLSKVAVQGRDDPAPRLVLDSIAPTNMDVPYDVGTTEFDDMVMFGFGTNASTMTEAECPQGEIRKFTLTSEYWFGGWSEQDRPTLCLREVGTGLAYRSSWWSDGVNLTAQGSALQVSMESAIGNYEYETRYLFNDNGTIDVGMGATGEIGPTIWADRVSGLNAESYGWPIGTGQKDYASSHYHSAVWRVDFGIDGKNDQQVEQTDTVWTKKRGPQSALLRTDRTRIGTESLLNPAKRRSWRVFSPSSLNADGHPRGYEILFGKQDSYDPNPSLRNALGLTSAKDCEQYGDRNISYVCNGRSLVDYANGESLTDPVAWVNVGFHHIVRDEDQSPMPTHWQGFSLVPRGFWAQSPLTPTSRRGFNGRLAEGGPDRPAGRPTTTTLSLSTTSLTPGVVPKGTVKVVSEAARVVGVVTVYDGENEILETVMRDSDNGVIPVELPKLALGNHTLTAYFSGSDTAAASTSLPVVASVSRYASTTAATLASSSVTTTQQAVLNVKVTSSVEPVGFLVVSDGTRTLATQKLPVGANGTAQITLPRQARGTYALTVSYQGNGDVGDSTSPTRTLTVR